MFSKTDLEVSTVPANWCLVTSLWCGEFQPKYLQYFTKSASNKLYPVSNPLVAELYSPQGFWYLPPWTLEKVAVVLEIVPFVFNLYKGILVIVVMPFWVPEVWVGLVLLVPAAVTL